MEHPFPFPKPTVEALVLGGHGNVPRAASWIHCIACRRGTCVVLYLIRSLNLSPLLHSGLGLQSAGSWLDFQAHFRSWPPPRLECRLRVHLAVTSIIRLTMTQGDKSFSVAQAEDYRL